MYILSKTSEPLNIGDHIVLDLTKDLPNGNVEHHHIECKFIPQLIPLLLEQGVIELVEPEKSPECRMTYTLQELVSMNQALSKKVEVLSKRVCSLEHILRQVVSIASSSLSDAISFMVAFTDAKKDAPQPKGKQGNKKNHPSGKQKD